jgi:hypothetical protein
MDGRIKLNELITWRFSLDLDGIRLGTAAGAATATAFGTAMGSAQEVVALLPRVQT